jgi:hypothetical protein
MIQLLLWLPLLSLGAWLLLGLTWGPLVGGDALLPWLWLVSEAWLPDEPWSVWCALNSACVLSYGFLLSRPSLAAYRASTGVIPSILYGYLALLSVLCWLTVMVAIVCTLFDAFWRTLELLWRGTLLWMLARGLGERFTITFIWRMALNPWVIGLIRVGWVTGILYAAVPVLLSHPLDPARSGEFFLWHTITLLLVMAMLAAPIIARQLMDDSPQLSPERSLDDPIR